MLMGDDSVISRDEALNKLEMFNKKGVARAEEGRKKNRSIGTIAADKTFGEVERCNIEEKRIKIMQLSVVQASAGRWKLRL